MNPVAGRGRGATRGAELARALEGLGLRVETFATAGRGEARARVARLERDVGLVASVGGDGTLSEVLAGLPRRDVAVGVLPMGTANVLGLDLGLPRDPARAARVMLGGRTQRLDTGRVGERLCFLGVSAGYDAAVVHALERIRRGPITRWTWSRAALAEFHAYAPPALDVEVDGTRIDGAHGLVLLANVVNYAGWPTLAGDRRLDDGLFEAYLFPARSRLELLRHAARGIMARFPGGGVRLVTGRRFRVASAVPVPVQVDGDAAGTTPFELVIEAEPCRILVP